MLHESLLLANCFAACKCQLHKTTDQKTFALKVAQQVVLRDKSYKAVHTATRNTEDFRTPEKDQKEHQKKYSTQHTLCFIAVRVLNMVHKSYSIWKHFATVRAGIWLMALHWLRPAVLVLVH
jgi:hypothetical protein